MFSKDNGKTARIESEKDKTRSSSTSEKRSVGGKDASSKDPG